MVHDWGEQLQVGTDGERVLDTIFSPLGTLTEATREQQRAGIDRILLTPEGLRQTFEYKTDTRAHKTGNAYIETLSVSTTGKAGWLFTCTADTLVYYTPGDGRVRIIAMAKMRKAAEDWQWECAYARAQNKTYYGEGLLVPLQYLDAIAEKVVELGVDHGIHSISDAGVGIPESAGSGHQQANVQHEHPATDAGGRTRNQDGHGEP